MRDACAHTVRNALPRARSLLLNARLSVKLFKIAETEKLLVDIERCLQELDTVFRDCMRGGEKCCGELAAQAGEGRKGLFGRLRRVRD